MVKYNTSISERPKKVFVMNQIGNLEEPMEKICNQNKK